MFTAADVEQLLGQLADVGPIGFGNAGSYGSVAQTVAALPAIITGIQAAGYTLEPVCN